MNVVSMPIKEPARAKSSPKAKKLSKESSKTQKKSSAFDDLVDSPSTDNHRKGAVSGRSQSSMDNNNDRQDLSQDTSTNSESINQTLNNETERSYNNRYDQQQSQQSEKSKNPAVAEYLYNYQKASAENNFMVPGYNLPDGFEDFAHPQFAEIYETAPQDQVQVVMPQMIDLTSQLNQMKAQSESAKAVPVGLDSLNISKMNPKDMLAALNELGNALNVNQKSAEKEASEKIVIPIPPALNFLNHNFEHIEPKEIPSIVSQSTFINSLLSVSDLEGAMNMTTSTANILDSLGFKKEEIPTLVTEIGEVSTINETLNQLGFDNQQIESELSILKNNLQLEGLTPYMQRAEELYNENSSAEVPSLVIEPDSSKEISSPVYETKMDEINALSESPKNGQLERLAAMNMGPKKVETLNSNSENVHVVQNLNEILTKEQIESDIVEKNIEKFGEENLSLDSKETGISELETSFEPEIDLEALSVTREQAPIESTNDSSFSGDSMLDTNSEIFEINETDSTKERVAVIKNIIDRARTTIEGKNTSMEFNIKTQGLGNINLAISTSENALQVSIKTDMEEARQLLTTEMNNLQESLGSISNEIQNIDVNVEHDESWTQNRDNFFENKERHSEQQQSNSENSETFSSRVEEKTEKRTPNSVTKTRSESSTVEVRV